MIIPIRCFSCGKPLADKYRYYLEEVRKLKLADGKDVKKVVYLTGTNTEKSAEAFVLDSLGLKSACCRRHMLTNCDIV